MRKLFILCLLCCNSAFAFEPQKHVEFSHDAAGLYNTCSGNSIAENDSNAFASGARKEDNPWPERGLNWHFYNNSGKIGEYRRYLFFNCNGSNEKIFAKRLAELKGLISEKAPKEDIYEAAGRVAHHIQDMSSPPHVVPIYHTSEDRFDKYLPGALPDSFSAETCKSLMGKVNISPDELLQSAAVATISAISTPVFFVGTGEVSGETWEKFWVGEDDKVYEGFISYGVYGNTYGKVVASTREKNRIKYNQETFVNFFNERRNHAVIDSALMLLYVDQLLKTK